MTSRIPNDVLQRLGRRNDAQHTQHRRLSVRKDWALGYRQVHLGRELHKSYRACTDHHTDEMHRHAYMDGRAAGLQDAELMTRESVGDERWAFVRAGRAARAAGILVNECRYLVAWQRELWREGWHAEPDQHAQWVPRATAAKAEQGANDE